MSEEPLTEEFLQAQAKHSRRCAYEAKFVGIVITVCMITTSTLIIFTGYIPSAERPEQPSLIFGIPSWVIYGLFVPWLVMIGITWLFAIFVLQDDPDI